jgi:hypothetical protein
MSKLKEHTLHCRSQTLWTIRTWETRSQVSWQSTDGLLPHPFESVRGLYRVIRSVARICAKQGRPPANVVGN